MKGDSFIYLNKNFLHNIYGDDIDHDHNIYNLVSKWVCFGKPNEMFFDRTNTICNIYGYLLVK